LVAIEQQLDAHRAPLRAGELQRDRIFVATATAAAATTATRGVLLLAGLVRRLRLPPGDRLVHLELLGIVLSLDLDTGFVAVGDRRPALAHLPRRGLAPRRHLGLAAAVAARRAAGADELLHRRRRAQHRPLLAAVARR